MATERGYVAVRTGCVNERRVMAPAKKETFMAVGDCKMVDKPSYITGMESSLGDVHKY
jgi:hypothetical protein